MYLEKTNYFNVAGGEPSVGDNFIVNGFDVTVGGVGFGQATLIVKSAENLSQDNTVNVDAVDFPAIVDVLGLTFSLPTNDGKNTVLANAGFSGSYWTSVQKGKNNSNGEIATIGQSGVQTVGASTKHQVFVFATTSVDNLKNSVPFYSASADTSVEEPTDDATATATTAQTTSIPDVPTTQSGVFTEVEGKFTTFLSLVEQVATELQNANGKLTNLKALCEKGDNKEACATAEELTTYVNELKSQLQTLTTANTTLNAFRQDIIDRIDDENITASNTNAEILAALDSQILALDTKIGELEGQVLGLQDDVQAEKNKIIALENEVINKINAIEGAGVNVTTVADALNDIDTAYGDLEDLRRDLADDLFNIKNAVMLADFDTDTLDGAVSAKYPTDEAGNKLFETKQYVQDYIDAIQGYIDTLNTDNTQALQDAEDDYTIALANAQSAFDTDLATEAGKVSAKQLKIDELESEIDGYNTNLTNSINSLVASKDLESGEGITLANLASEWETALRNYNTKVSELQTKEGELKESQATSSGLSTEKSNLESELAIANSTISEQEVRLNEMLEALEGVNAELGEFTTLSTTLDTEISELEDILSNMGYTPVTQAEETQSFNGGGLSEIFGEEPTEIQKLLFRGIEAKNAYLNMAGELHHNFSDNKVDTLDFNADGGTSTKPLVKLGLLAGLIYIGSKLLKK